VTVTRGNQAYKWNQHTKENYMSTTAVQIPGYVAGTWTIDPIHGEILGARVYPSLREVDLPVDVVDVFRPPEQAEAIAQDAVAIGADVLWFQPGTHTPQALRQAADAGLTVVAGRCLGATHGELGLGPGP
jgi:predicted CoA-binding protein